MFKAFPSGKKMKFLFWLRFIYIKERIKNYSYKYLLKKNYLVGNN